MIPSTHSGVQKSRVIAIDWSGRSGPDQKRVIWLAEARGGKLLRLENGRTRTEIVDELIAEAAPNLIVGFDFAFSLPGWYLAEQQLTARSLWAVLAEEALTPRMRSVGLAGWMNDPEPPFWVTGEAHRLLAPAQKMRRTDNEVREYGSQPKSVFQLVGAGQVGRGSLYGMRALDRLSTAGYCVWPFDPPAGPMVIEIFPRLLTGAVTKSSPVERERYVAGLGLDPDQRRLAASTEDAFDAAVSALVMDQAIAELGTLEPEPDYALEGKIWQPRTRVRLEAAHVRPDETDLVGAVADVITNASTQGESARTQAERVLQELARRGALR